MFSPDTGGRFRKVIHRIGYRDITGDSALAGDGSQPRRHPARNLTEGPTTAGLLAHRSSSLAQPSQPKRPVVRGGRDSLFTVAGAALELTVGAPPHQIPFSFPSGRKPLGADIGYQLMITFSGDGVNREIFEEPGDYNVVAKSVL